MSAGSVHFHAAQHELRSAIPPARCACGKPSMPGCGRCADCAEAQLDRFLDRKLELSRGELGDER